MPAYSLSLSPYFDTVGPFERELTHLVITNTADDVDPPPLTRDPGEQWLCLLWSLMGGRHVGVFAASDDTTFLASMARTNVELIGELQRWLKATKRSLRGLGPQRYLETGFTLWILPAPFPKETPWLLRELALMNLDDEDVEVTQPSDHLFNTIDQLFDLGAMFWRLEPGHLTLRLETRFVGHRELARHLHATARMAGVDLYEGP